MPDVAIWPACNLRCPFCSNPVRGYRNTVARYSYAWLRHKFAAYKKGGRIFKKFNDAHDGIVLTGGEPTLHPDFFRVLRLIRTEFPNAALRLLTNGRRLSNPTFARGTLALGGPHLTVAVPLFGFDARTHDRICGVPGSFAQTWAGLRNLRSLRQSGQRIEIRVILTRMQLPLLGRLLNFLLAALPDLDDLVFLYFEIEGFAAKHREKLLVSLPACARSLDRHYTTLRRFKAVRLYHFPLCALPTRLWPWAWNTLDAGKVMFRATCQALCHYREQCVGIHSSYARHMRLADFRPILEPRPVRLSGNPYHPVAGLSGKDTRSRHLP